MNKGKCNHGDEDDDYEFDDDNDDYDDDILKSVLLHMLQL